MPRNPNPKSPAERLMGNAGSKTTKLLTRLEAGAADQWLEDCSRVISAGIAAYGARAMTADCSTSGDPGGGMECARLALVGSRKRAHEGRSALETAYPGRGRADWLLKYLSGEWTAEEEARRQRRCSRVVRHDLAYAIKVIAEVYANFDN
jgi:hypothetical protein